MGFTDAGCEYYCIMVVSGQEEKFKAKANELLARNAHQHSSVQFFTKSMKTRKAIRKLQNLPAKTCSLCRSFLCLANI